MPNFAPQIISKVESDQAKKSIRLDTESCLLKFPLEGIITKQKSVNRRVTENSGASEYGALQMYTKMEAVERKFQEQKLKRQDKHRDFVVEQATLFLTSLNDLVAPYTEKKFNKIAVVD
jgi:hypothetical protein